MATPAACKMGAAATVRYHLISMVKEGYYYGIPLLAAGVAAWFAHWGLAAIAFWVLGAFTFYFFRNPDRVIPTEPGAIVSPADGRVLAVVDEESESKPGTRISIFLAIWNVHVNRAPASGVITRLDYRPGKFMVAARERASLENEQNVFLLSTETGDMVFKQIAGLIARRVVSWKNAGERVARGERIGLVRFGSRVDVWLPREAQVLIKVGQNVKGGTSVLAHWAPRESREPEAMQAIGAAAQGRQA